MARSTPTKPPKKAASPRRDPLEIQGAGGYWEAPSSGRRRAASPSVTRPAATPPKAKKAVAGKAVEPLSVVLKKAGKKALGGGLAGALAMVLQVALLMWMRTAVSYTHLTLPTILLV